MSTWYINYPTDDIVLDNNALLTDYTLLITNNSSSTEMNWALSTTNNSSNMKTKVAVFNLKRSKKNSQIKSCDLIEELWIDQDQSKGVTLEVLAIKALGDKLKNYDLENLLIKELNSFKY